MTKGKYNPGTKRGDVHKAYDDAGEDAARKLGTKLGVKSTRLNRWFGMWSGKVADSSRSRKAKPRSEGASKEAVAMTEPLSVATASADFRLRKGNVYWASRPDIEGVILRHGDETSDVRWLNGNRHEDVPNEWLGFV
jgi:hypothetical protein